MSKVETRINEPERAAILGATRPVVVRDAGMLIGSPVVASDGEAGKVADFLFDDRSWEIRHIVLDVGNWLRRHCVVLPVSVFPLPDWERKKLSIQLTRAEVNNSPDVDTQKPVYRQQQLARRKYLGPLACWVDAGYRLASMPAWVRYPAPPNGDPHLRSVRHLFGYRVRATDGYFGRLNGFLMDEDSWRLAYIEIGVPQPLHRVVAAPTAWVDSISWAEFRIYLRHERVGA